MAGERVAGSERRVLDERRAGVEGGGDREDRRQLLVVDPDEAGGLLGRIERLGGDGGDRLAVVVRLADRQDRPIAGTAARSAASAAAGRRRS